MAKRRLKEIKWRKEEKETQGSKMDKFNYGPVSPFSIPVRQLIWEKFWSRGPVSNFSIPVRRLKILRKLWCGPVLQNPIPIRPLSDCQNTFFIHLPKYLVFHLPTCANSCTTHQDTLHTPLAPHFLKSSIYTKNGTSIQHTFTLRIILHLIIRSLIFLALVYFLLYF